MRRLSFLVPFAAFALLLAHPALAESAPGQAQVVKMAVTQDGFVPETVNVKAGQPVTLEITRIVQATCATEIVMKDFGINQPLPLDKKVSVTFTPKKKGEYRFSCGMGHIRGVVKAG